jgi:hypothetical protein
LLVLEAFPKPGIYGPKRSLHDAGRCGHVGLDADAGPHQDFLLQLAEFGIAARQAGTFQRSMFCGMLSGYQDVRKDMVVGQLLPISKAMNAATYATTSHDCLIHHPPGS